MALMTALMIGKEAFALSFRRRVRLLRSEGGGCRWSGCGTSPQWERRSEATAEKHCLGLRVGGEAACVEGY